MKSVTELQTTSMPEQVYILDVFSLVFQVFYGIPPMTGPQGQPTNAVYGFTRDLISLLRDRRPHWLFCAMDSPGPGKRVEIYPEYKANRAEMPEDLKPQIPMIEEIMGGFGLPMFQQDGWEADDMFATLTRLACERELEVRIVTSDKDARQLLGPRVQLYDIRRDRFLDEAFLAEDWGVRPDQVIDFQTLVGDSVDNIPGVPLVGVKKAEALLREFGSLDEVLARADEAPGKKLRENLVTYADQARMSRELVTLKTDLPLEVDWDSQAVGRPDVERLIELFREYGFRSFADDVRAMAGDAGSKPAELFPPAERHWETVDTPAKFRKFLGELSPLTRFCFDLETTGLDELLADIVGWAFSWEAGHGWYLPVQAPAGDRTLDAAAVVEALRPILENPAVEKTNQNIKYDMLVLRRAGVRLEGIGVDPMIGSYLLDAGARSHGLDALAQKYLGHSMIPISDLIGSGNKQKSMAEIPVADVAEYASEDADVSWQVAELVSGDLKRQNLWDLYWDLERPLVPVLADMEFAGIRLDSDELGRQAGEVGERLERLIAEIHELAGHEFNIDSPKQLQVVLFDELGLPVQKRTRTGASTDQSVLEQLAPLHPLPTRMIEHRHLAKLKGTYLDALPELVHPDTGRLHTSFNQVVTATGRLSSTHPNLQNIPVRTEEGRRVRRAFVAGDDGQVLVCADYSQVELRMLAHFSGDPVLRQAFAQDADIHTVVATEIFGVADDEIDSNRRRVAKAVNFGVIYGQSPFGLAKALGIPQADAATFIDGYFDRYRGVADYLEQLLDQCLDDGYARTILGRRRAIRGIREHRPPRQRNMPERTAINTVIQGSAADLIKKAMINVDARIADERHPGTMLLQIHDELVFETPRSHLDSLITLVEHEMQSALDLDVPLTIDITTGPNWLDQQPVQDR